jgi:hypothetical protein
MCPLRIFVPADFFFRVVLKKASFGAMALWIGLRRALDLLVAGDVRVNGAGPGVDAAGEGLGVGEALVA